MLKLTDEQLNWLLERIPDSPKSPLGGRPTANKRKVVRGIFWMLDNGAKWKDLPRKFGSKSTVHRWFQKWVTEGVFENVMRTAGRCVEEGKGYRVYECYIDGSFCKAKGGGDGIGCTRADKGVKIMIMVDARGLPVAAYSTTASKRESHPVQQLFEFMVMACNLPNAQLYSLKSSPHAPPVQRPGPSRGDHSGAQCDLPMSSGFSDDENGCECVIAMIRGNSLTSVLLLPARQPEVQFCCGSCA